MLHTVDEVAKMLTVHPRTIRRYIDKGLLRAERVGGSWRISQEALAEMFDAPETKDSITKHISQRSEDMLDMYFKGKHRLQQDNLVMMCVFVFNPTQDTWVPAKIMQLMAELNRLGQDAKYDFTMTGGDQDLYRLTLIAPPVVLQGIIAELERLRQEEGS